MDWNRVEGNWKEMKGKVKAQWGKLTDDDLDVIAGKQDQLEGRHAGELLPADGPHEEPDEREHDRGPQDGFHQGATQVR